MGCQYYAAEDDPEQSQHSCDRNENQPQNTARVHLVRHAVQPYRGNRYYKYGRSGQKSSLYRSLAENYRADDGKRHTHVPGHSYARLAEYFEYKQHQQHFEHRSKRNTVNRVHDRDQKFKRKHLVLKFLQSHVRSRQQNRDKQRHYPYSPYKRRTEALHVIILARLQVFEKDKWKRQHDWRTVDYHGDSAFKHLRADDIGFFRRAYAIEKRLTAVFEKRRNVGRFDYAVDIYRLYLSAYLVHDLFIGYARDICDRNYGIRKPSYLEIEKAEFGRTQAAAYNYAVGFEILYKSFSGASQNVGHGRFLYPSRRILAF